MTNIDLQPVLQLIQGKITLSNIAQHLWQHQPLSVINHPIVGGGIKTKGNLKGTYVDPLTFFWIDGILLFFSLLSGNVGLAIVIPFDMILYPTAIGIGIYGAAVSTNQYDLWSALSMVIYESILFLMTPLFLLPSTLNLCALFWPSLIFQFSFLVLY